MSPWPGRPAPTSGTSTPAESIALEYSRYNYHGKLFYKTDPYRSSDHDPVVARAAGRPPRRPRCRSWGSTTSTAGSRRTAPRPAPRCWPARSSNCATSNPKTVFAAAGDLIGASTFESFIEQDKPTIDALNAAGLEVSAVGNHEFDQGYDDLVEPGDGALRRRRPTRSAARSGSTWAPTCALTTTVRRRCRRAGCRTSATSRSVSSARSPTTCTSWSRRPASRV